jgi:aminoglycoside phosphotransferase (APT) family kinase protein
VSTEPATTAEALARTLAPVLGDGVAVDDLQRLSGGASRETWAFRVGDRELILRRDPPGRPGMPGSMALEADAMRACGRAGLPVPEVLVDDDGSNLGTAGLVMGRVPGETLARRILRDDEFATAREVLAGQLGRFLPASTPSTRQRSLACRRSTRSSSTGRRTRPSTTCRRRSRRRSGGSGRTVPRPPARSSSTATSAWGT